MAAVIVAAAVTVFAVAADDDGGGQTAGVAGDLPAAPWRVATVPRPDVPPAYVAAWDRARNRAGCALLFPLDGGPALNDAEATAERTPEDRGWDIFLTGEAGSVEILGLFDQAPRADHPPGPPSFTRHWSDGSVAKYGPDAGTAAAGPADPNTSPFEAVLTLPDQACAYRLYDTLGKDHLEYIFARLRLMAR